MSEEDFLKRWSRRKREADVAKSDPPEAEAGDVAASAQPKSGAVSDKSSDKPQAEFDPATLPPIESITAVSDVTAFLRAGVPVELTRAALRRVWTTDPAIRDFVGLAENAWDFTDPDAMHGFGPLESTDEVRQMIARLVDSIGQAAQPAESEAVQETAEVSKNSNDSNVIDVHDDVDSGSPATPITDKATENHAEILSSQVLLRGNKEDVALREDAAEAVEKPKQLPRRGHGRALPR